MPELPEVEVLKRYFDESALHKKIVNVDYLDDKNTVFKSSRQELGQNLLHNKFTETQCIGKYLFARISNGKWLHLHFGMTGKLEVFTDQDSMPRHTRMAIHFADGSKLAYVDARKFGVIRIVDGPKEFQQKNKLGEDVLEISEKNFIKGIEGRKVAIKTALLDQKNFSGIGNWIADEMLYETGIHPETQCADLSEKEMKELHKAAVKICREALKAKTEAGHLPKKFFFNYRKEGAKHPDHPRSAVKKLTVGGRSTYIVPAKQKKKD